MPNDDAEAFISSSITAALDLGLVRLQPNPEYPDGTVHLTRLGLTVAPVLESMVSLLAENLGDRLPAALPPRSLALVVARCLGANVDLTAELLGDGS